MCKHDTDVNYFRLITWHQYFIGKSGQSFHPQQTFSNDFKLLRLIVQTKSSVMQIKHNFPYASARHQVSFCQTPCILTNQPAFNSGDSFHLLSPAAPKGRVLFHFIPPLDTGPVKFWAKHKSSTLYSGNASDGFTSSAWSYWNNGSRQTPKLSRGCARLPHPWQVMTVAALPGWLYLDGLAQRSRTVWK